MRRIGSRISIGQNAPMANVDTISEDIAFIKITVLFPTCFDAQGNVDIQKVKEVVRGIWRIRNAQTRSRIKYLAALYRGHIVGVFHVTGVSQKLPQAYAQGLPDFPTHPADVRECDRWKARFATTVQAQQVLTSAEYNRFIASITRGNATTQHVLDLYRERVYFSVDDNVPSHLAQLVGCRIKRTSGLGGRILANSFDPVITNF